MCCKSKLDNQRRITVSDSSLFNISVATIPHEPSPTPRASPPVQNVVQEVGIVTTSQAAITFAGAPAAVIAVWKVAGSVVPIIATNYIFPVVLSLIIGMAIYYAAPAAGSRRAKIIGCFFALINSFAIAAATLGINSVADPTNGSTPNPAQTTGSPASSASTPKVQ